jgi:predicted alpha/beta-fold hydrolase
MCWPDSKEITDYVHDKYVIDQKTGNKKVKLYGYGCSLGANLLGLQLINEGIKTKYDAASLYATPWAMFDGWNHFFNHNFGLYSWAIGQNLSKIWEEQLPQMKPFISEKVYK